jgi:hypothetical protein
MKRLDDSKIRLVLVVFVAAIVLGGRIAKADFAFGIPVNLGPIVNSPSGEISPSLSADGLSLYFASNRPGGSGEYDLWVTTRSSTTAQWGAPENLGTQVNSAYSEVDPSISSDGLSLYFSDPHDGLGFGRPRPGGFAAAGLGNVWVVTRPTVHDPWSAPVNLGPALNSTIYRQVVQPCISADGLSLYVHACSRGIGVATRPSTNVPFETPAVLAFPGNGAQAWWPGISADERALFFTQWTGAVFELWLTRRPTADSDFGPPTKLPGYINVPNYQVSCPNFSENGSSLYFDSTQPGGMGGYDMYEVPIIPILDFNGDGIVEIGDLLFLIESWGQDDSTTDIGPAPWGDGIVDVQDLEVLMSHWGQEVEDPTLAAHWKLDETEGSIAEDSAGDNNGIVFGDAVWQPDGGMIKGALQFDGIDDYIETDFVLNPAEGAFSVFAWIKGGDPGQVVLSQTGGANWLSADPSEGNFTTELVPPTTRSPLPPLVSETVITDGNWHHIGFVWNGAYRTLYVDGVIVAEDIQSNLASSSNGLYIGTGKNLDAGTFFSGLIDDIRIYNKTLSQAQITAVAQ